MNKVSHYHVEMSADWLKKDNKRRSDSMAVDPVPNPAANPNDDGAGIPKAKRTELIMRLQTEVRPDLFRTQGAFDGKANLYSTKDYDFRSQVFEVPWAPPRSGRDGSRGGGRAGGQQKPRMAKITITKVNDVDRSHIQKLIRGDPESIKSGSEAMVTLNMLNVFVQAAPKMQSGTLFNARSFYVKPNGNGRGAVEVSGFEIWRGYYQTVRPTFDRLIVNIDLTVGVVVPQKRLVDLFQNYLNLRDTRHITNLTRDQPNFRALKLFAKQLKFRVDLPGHTGKRPQTIWDLVPDAGSVTFDKHGEDVSVADHFFRAHQVTIPPRTLGVKTKKGAIYPITVCLTIEQLYRGKNAPNVTTAAMQFMPQSPRDRLESIIQSRNHLQYSQSPFMVQAGLSVNNSPVPVHGRLLSGPKLGFDSDKPRIFDHKRPGVWDVMGRRFWRPAPIPSWAVICFESRAPSELVGKFVEGLAREMRGHGMNVGPYTISQPRNGHGDVYRILREEGARAGANLLLVILPENAEELRNNVKRFGDITQGVPTQCVRWGRRREDDVRNNRINQYHNNLILKINMRMGGINFAPSGDRFGKIPTMVLGADVSHPGLGSQQPSVSALVGSVDRWYTRYVSATRVQDPRLEMIDDMEGMFEQVLEQFKKFNNRYPAQLIFYRDGVSEGEFAQVSKIEIPRIAAVIARKFGPNQKDWPILTFLVVGKKHHQRFFPRDGSGQDMQGNQNLLPGYIVDVDIVHPVYSDFYLQSQAGLKGTSRPSHYTVIRVTKMSIDELQEFTFHLCHCYLRSTRSVKIPAPVYYADLVCSRAKFHFGDNASVSGDSGTSSEFDLQMWKKQFSPIHPNIAATMYWV
ncbi:hypothetical protein AX15_004709 [Amanita polypyramis BW_CC]|nr:hypothetical protein AX15_004709 [Amanita polypyramis BW_CC]